MNDDRRIAANSDTVSIIFFIVKAFISVTIINSEFDIKDIISILFFIFPVDINGVSNEEITKINEVVDKVIKETATEKIL